MADYIYILGTKNEKIGSALIDDIQRPGSAFSDYTYVWTENGSTTLNVPSLYPQKGFHFSNSFVDLSIAVSNDSISVANASLNGLFETAYNLGTLEANENTNILNLLLSVKRDEVFWNLYYSLSSEGSLTLAQGYSIDEPTKNIHVNNLATAGSYVSTITYYNMEYKKEIGVLFLSGKDKQTEEIFGSLVVIWHDTQMNQSQGLAYGFFNQSVLFYSDIESLTTFGNWTNVEEGSTEYGDYSGGGGYGGGSFDDSSDAFGLPSLPSLGVSEVGFINVYNPSKGQLQGFADELFPNFEMPTPSTATGIEAVAENLANTFEVLGDFAESYVNAGLINYVIDCHIVPVAPVTNGTSKIKVGFKTFNYTPAKVTSDYVEFDCGTLEIAEYYQNFLDYEGTKAKLYLPFIGFVDIKPEWFQSGKLGVTYHFNIIDGSCIAFVIATSSKSKLTNTVVATFGGNCCVHMPITGVNYSSMISGVVGGAVGIASNASNMIKTNRADKGTVMSNIEGATGIASSLADAVGAKPSIEQSNGYNAGMSFMCYRRPYLLIERPVASFSKNYPKEQGLPLNVTKKLGTMKGFTTCAAPVVDNFHCLEEEKEMIKQALIEGTIF